MQQRLLNEVRTPAGLGDTSSGFEQVHHVEVTSVSWAPSAPIPDLCRRQHCSHLDSGNRLAPFCRMRILLDASSGDVYSFGAILRELLTRKEPTGSHFKGWVEGRNLGAVGSTAHQSWRTW